MSVAAARPSMLRTFARSVLPRPARNWLRRPLRSVHDMYDESLFCLGVVRRHEIRPGWQLTTHPGAFRMAFWAQVQDPMEAREFDRFVASCRPGMVLFDVGAHFGLFSLAALHYAPSAFCVAVEPSLFAARMLRLHATLNSPEGRLLIRRAAAGREVGAVRMVDDGPLVPSLTVDALGAEYGVVPTHLKVDVQGTEAAVIAGAERCLTASDGRRPVVFLQLHTEMIRSRGQEPAEVLNALIGFGYRLETTTGMPLSVETAVAPRLTRLVALPRE